MGAAEIGEKLTGEHGLLNRAVVALEMNWILRRSLATVAREDLVEDSETAVGADSVAEVGAQGTAAVRVHAEVRSVRYGTRFQILVYVQ